MGCEAIAIIVTDKQCVKLLEKFRDQVSYLHDSELGKTTAANTTAGGATNKTVSQSGSEAGSEDLSMSSLSISGSTSGSVAGKTPVPKRSTRGSRAKSTKT